MIHTDALTLPDEQMLALAHTPRALRARLQVILALDHRLGRLVAGTTEPMLGQMRLAWWRDALAQPAANRPRGDAVLDAIGETWEGHEGPLRAMVDGWEYMLAEVLDKDAAIAFAKGRAAPFAAFADMAGVSSLQEEALRIGERWALADAATNLSGGEERDIMIDLGSELGAPRVVPRALRGLAILNALAMRSLAGGGQPMMLGRVSALIALRVSIFGR